MRLSWESTVQEIYSIGLHVNAFNFGYQIRSTQLGLGGVLSLRRVNNAKTTNRKWPKQDPNAIGLNVNSSNLANQCRVLALRRVNNAATNQRKWSNPQFSAFSRGQLPMRVRNALAPLDTPDSTKCVCATTAPKNPPRLSPNP